MCAHDTHEPANNRLERMVLRRPALHGSLYHFSTLCLGANNTMSTWQLPAPIAIIDVETTGLCPHRHDRIVEVAAVVMDGAGRMMREFVSLVNSGRDIGPSSIHGLTAEGVLYAPHLVRLRACWSRCCTGPWPWPDIMCGSITNFLEANFLDSAWPCLNALPSVPCSLRAAGGSPSAVRLRSHAGRGGASCPSRCSRHSSAPLHAAARPTAHVAAARLAGADSMARAWAQQEATPHARRVAPATKGAADISATSSRTSPCRC
jgi:hypothetical protein